MLKQFGDFFRFFAYSMDQSFMDIRCLWIDILLLGMIAAFFYTAIWVLLKKYKGGRFLVAVLFTVISIGGILAFSYVSLRLPRFCYRLSSILSNASFIIGHTENRKELFSVLGIPDTATNAEQLKDIIYYLSPAEWNKAIKETGSMSWYLTDVRDSLERTIRFGCRLGDSVRWNVGAFIPASVLIIGCQHLMCDEKAVSLCMLLSAAICFVEPYGASVFLLAFVLSHLALRSGLASLERANEVFRERKA